jgi:hypothetical protein
MPRPRDSTLTKYLAGRVTETGIADLTTPGRVPQRRR